MDKSLFMLFVGWCLLGLWWAIEGWSEHAGWVEPRVFLPFLFLASVSAASVVMAHRFGAPSHTSIWCLVLLIVMGTGNLSALTSPLLIGIASFLVGQRVVQLLGQKGEHCSGMLFLPTLMVGVVLYALIIWVLMHFPINFALGYFILFLAPLLLWRQKVIDIARHTAHLFHSRESAWSFLAGAITLFYLPYCLTVTQGSDAVVKHLYVPHQLRLFHQFIFDPRHLVTLDTAITPQSLFCAAFMIGGDHGVQLLNLSLFVVAVIGFGVAIEGKVSKRVALIASVISWTTPILTWTIAEVFLDTSSFFGSSSLLVWYLLASRQRLSRYSAGFGVLIAAGYYAKQQTLFVLLPVTVFFIIDRVTPLLALIQSTVFPRTSPRDLLPLSSQSHPYSRALLSGVSSCAIMGGSALLMLSPVLLKNYVVSGNPLYPFYNGIFRSPYFPPVNFKHDIWAQPLNLELWNTIFFRGGRLVEGVNWSMGFMLFACLPFGIFVAKRFWRGSFFVLVFIAGGMLWYKLTHPYLRYFLTILPLAAVVSAFTVESLYRSLPQKRVYRRLAVASSCIVVLFHMVLMVSLPHVPRPYPIKQLLTGDLHDSSLEVNEYTSGIFKIPGLVLGKNAKGLFLNIDYLALANTKVVGTNWHFPYNRELYFDSPKSAAEAFELIFLKEKFSYIAIRKEEKGLPAYWRELEGMLQPLFSWKDLGIYVPR